jgi:hypothetical protein
LKHFKLKSNDDQLFYSFQLDKDNKIGNLMIEKNEKLNKFSNDVYSLHMEKHNLKTNSVSKQGEDCCRHASGWSACMDCTVSVCSSNWACAITFALVPAETAAAFSLSCLGAGANTFC